MAGLFGRKRTKQNGALAESVDSESLGPQESARSLQKSSNKSSRWSLRRQSHRDDDNSSLDASSNASTTRAASTARRRRPEVSPVKKKKKQSPQKPKEHVRRNSFGGSAAGVVENGSASRRSSRYSSSRKSSRRQSNKFEYAEEEKKEISLHEGEEYYDSPEFRNRVAQEAADLDKEGNVYFEKGDFDKAFMSYERALKLKRATLQEDPAEGKNEDMLNETEAQKASILASVATSINNMTYLRQRAGQATADETMAAYLKSLQIKREILGVNHLSVGKTLNNIGSVFYLKKEFVPALKAYENAHDIMSAQLGADHLDVGTVLSNIGDVHSALRHRREALEFYRRALDIRWTKLGRADPKVIRLLEQSAALLTGRQPKKEQDELSESEDEEFVKEDEKKREVFKAECRALAQEVVADIKFFDSMERKIALEMVKQKTEFQRVLRQLAKNTLAENFEYYSDATESDYETDDYTSEGSTRDDDELSVMSAPPDLDLESDVDVDEAPEVLAFLQEIGAPAKTPPRKPATGPRTPNRKQVGPGTPNSGRSAAKGTPKASTPRAPMLKAGGKTPTSLARKRASKPVTPKTPTRKAAARTPPGRSAAKTSAGKPNTPRTPAHKASAKTPATSPITPASASPKLREDASPIAPPALPRAAGGETPQRQPGPVDATVALNTTPRRPTAGERLHASRSRRHLTAKYLDGKSQPKRKPATLTAEERRLALLSVKDRVQTMRSKRQTNGEVELNAEQAAEARRQDKIEPKRSTYLDSARADEGQLNAEQVAEARRQDKIEQKRTTYLASVRAQSVQRARIAPEGSLASSQAQSVQKPRMTPEVFPEVEGAS
mmetsp:Transcript_21186/g.58635  ORF Transcript_21186/g.58635 Transcript_21186/m.58635 type:complete len:839 (-) Transcript_21186:649-3165(-)